MKTQEITKIKAQDRFTELEMFAMFNIDMVVAGSMDAKDVRGTNVNLWKNVRQDDIEKSDPLSVSVKFENGEMTGTVARINRLNELCEQFEGVTFETVDPE